MTRFEGDAIVNAANSSLLGGGGVDGAIHRAAGPALLHACRSIPELERGVRCPTGQARLTRCVSWLAVPAVIHAVSPVYQDALSSSPLLASAYAYALVTASCYGLQRIAFPAISCGIFGYPHADAARVATRVLLTHTRGLREVHVVLPERRHLDVWRRVVQEEVAAAQA